MRGIKTAVNQNEFLADWARSMRDSGLRDMIGLILQPDILSLASGLPASELFPLKALGKAAARVFDSPPESFQYRPPSIRLRTHIAKLMGLTGVTADPEQILITTGAQQGLDIVTRLLLKPHGQVILEEASYTGIRQALAPLQPQIITVPTSMDSGMNVAEVERHLRSGVRPAFIYAMSRGHNPRGVSMSWEKRLRLIEVAREYNVPIIEDDVYGFLSYETSAFEPDRPLWAIDSDLVFYVGSFSKILAPALRIGWMCAPKSLRRELSVMKETCDLETSAFIQNMVAAFLNDTDLETHIRMLRSVCRQRRDAMLNALRTHLDGIAHWSAPTHGLFIWVVLPVGINATRLLEEALRIEKVAFVPGSVFAVDGSQAGGNCIRLNFSQATPSQIEDGVLRIARLVRSA
jgi:2-aminoadipate transaminase